MTININKVIEQVVKSHDINVEGDGHPAIEMVVEPPTYIYPTLNEISRIEIYKPVLIFSAPGAVGKTTFAKYFSNLKNSYYWDLSKIKLGDNTFIGTIARHFGHQNLGDILTKLAKGQLSFFFDGFDEAEMISGLDGIDSFIREVYQTVRSAPFPAVVLFSRTETVEWIKLALDDVSDKTVYSLYEIDYFDRKGAIEFVKFTLTDLGDTSFRTHEKSFNGALQNIFETISHGLEVEPTNIWNNDKTRSFLGYSPVLQTISQYLSNQNYYEIQQKFTGNSQLEGVELIKDFANTLLKREQSKVVNVLKQNTNHPGDFNWDNVYNPITQLSVVFTYLAEGNSLKNIDIFIDGPDWLKKTYLESIHQFLPNHPFIRNSDFANNSFKDYTLSNLAEDDWFRSEILDYMNKNNDSSILFAHYYHSIYQGVFTPEYAGHLYEAVLSGLQLNSNAVVSVENSSSNSYVLSISYQKKEKGFDELIFESLSSNQPIKFYRKLHNAEINIEGSLYIDSASNSFEIKESNIITKNLSINSRILIPNCYDGADSSIIANNIVDGNHQLKIKKMGSGQFTVNFPGSTRFPWAEFSDSSLKVETGDEEEIIKRMYAIRLILKPFRKHKKGIFGKQHEYIENVIVKDNPIKMDVFNRMISAGILYKKSNEPIYELNDERLQENGINWAELKSLTKNSKVVDFLK